MTKTLGCASGSCSSCPSRGLAGCQPRTLNGLGFAFPSTSTIDITDPKTWIIAAMAAALIYQLLFTSEKHERRARRRAARSDARERYRAELQRIREAE